MNTHDSIFTQVCLGQQFFFSPVCILILMRLIKLIFILKNISKSFSFFGFDDRQLGILLGLL